MNARPQHCWCPLNTVSFIFKFDVIKKKNESEINICVKKMAIFSHQLFFWSTCQNRAAENCCVAPQAIQGMWCSNPDVLLSLLFPTFKIYAVVLKDIGCPIYYGIYLLCLIFPMFLVHVVNCGGGCDTTVFHCVVSNKSVVSNISDAWCQILPICGVTWCGACDIDSNVWWSICAVSDISEMWCNFWYMVSIISDTRCQVSSMPGIKYFQ